MLIVSTITILITDKHLEYVSMDDTIFICELTYDVNLDKLIYSNNEIKHRVLDIHKSTNTWNVMITTHITSQIHVFENTTYKDLETLNIEQFLQIHIIFIFETFFKCILERQKLGKTFANAHSECFRKIHKVCSW